MKSMPMVLQFELPGVFEPTAPWGLAFGGVKTVKECKGVSLVLATRTAQDTWEIEAGLTDLACLTAVTGEEFRGRYRMPFLITVVCKVASQCPLL